MSAKVKVTIDKACNHYVKPLDKVTLSKEKKDKLEWTIESDCSQAQDVVFCAYDATHALVNPFTTTASNPPGLKVGIPFPVGANGEASLDCEGTAIGNYNKLVLVGAEAAKGCPDREPLTETHRLAVEIKS